MKFNELERRLKDHFTRVRYTDGNGRILVGPSTFPLDAQIETLLESEEDREILEAFGYEEVLKERRSVQPLISFHYDSLGPCTFSHGLDLLTIGKHQSYLAIWSDACLCIGTHCSWIGGFGVHVVIMAALEYGNQKRLLETLFKDLISSNGVPYGREMFGSLPSDTENKCEELISRETIEDSYWQWMVAAGKDDPSLWYSLEEGVLADERYANPMERSLSTLRGLPPSSSPSAVQEWLDGRVQNGLDQSDEERRIYFEAYFRNSYSGSTCHR